MNSVKQDIALMPIKVMSRMMNGVTSSVITYLPYKKDTDSTYGLGKLCDMEVPPTYDTLKDIATIRRMIGNTSDE